MNTRKKVTVAAIAVAVSSLTGCSLLQPQPPVNLVPTQQPRIGVPCNNDPTAICPPPVNG
jgi:hypothetical protein